MDDRDTKCSRFILALASFIDTIRLIASLVCYGTHMYKKHLQKHAIQQTQQNNEGGEDVCRGVSVGKNEERELGA